ncbi:hypothetical protein [Burkholderia gladioli]|uniref:hypothetical protein n=1 Tax=Burkholderia gladioli TaxID=28095 RepID=UPI0011B27DC6|nr:hypothetical protein [Burkholderia gladioli]
MPKKTELEIMQMAAAMANHTWTGGQRITEYQWLTKSGLAHDVLAKSEPIPERLPVPRMLYKYMKRKYADSLITSGNVRIGTLHGFRDVERFGVGIADPMEGKKSVVEHIEHRKYLGGTPDANALKQLGIEIGKYAAPTISNAAIQIDVDHPDAYVWCCSRSKSRAAMEKIDGADTCVEIFDVDGFYGALIEAMRNTGDFKVAGPLSVIYHSLVERWNGKNLGEHPMFMKGRFFSDQEEVRIGWIPTAREGYPLQQHVDIPQSGIGRFCRIVEV